MKKYNITLLKDLPGISSGFNCTVTECSLDGNFGINHYGCPENMTQREYDQIVNTILRYKDYSNFIKIELDMSSAYPLSCPNCNSVGLFPYEDDKKEREYEGGGVTYWYLNVGLECPKCAYKLKTHKVCVGKHIDW